MLIHSQGWDIQCSRFFFKWIQKSRWWLHPDPWGSWSNLRIIFFSDGLVKNHQLELIASPHQFTSLCRPGCRWWWVCKGRDFFNSKNYRKESRIWSKSRSSTNYIDFYTCMKNTDVYLDLPKGVKWFQGVSINHPLGFLWHPLEGAGMYNIYIYEWIPGWKHKIQMTNMFQHFHFFSKKNTQSH